MVRRSEARNYDPADSMDTHIATATETTRGAEIQRAIEVLNEARERRERSLSAREQMQVVDIATRMDVNPATMRALISNLWATEAAESFNVSLADGFIEKWLPEKPVFKLKPFKVNKSMDHRFAKGQRRWFLGSTEDDSETDNEIMVPWSDMFPTLERMAEQEEVLRSRLADINTEEVPTVLRRGDDGRVRRSYPNITY